MKNITLLLAVLYIGALSASAQKGYTDADLSEPDRIRCGTAIINNQRLAEEPKLQQIFETHNKLAIENEKNMAKNDVSNKKGPILYTIPVVYHIIHDEGVGNISKASINASIQNLNDDFQKLNSDVSQVVASFTGIVADCQIQFRLAHIDPNGNCTEGITRTSSPLTHTAGENVKGLVNWNTTKYLNIWVVQTLTSGAGGYSYYPGYAPSQSAEGVVIRSSQLGNSVTHEVGHYLNLPHCWGNTNNPGISTNCNTDDGVGDTPNTIGQTGCNLSYSSCSSLDNVQNYMEYSFCERMFTNGQKSRMHTALGSSFGSRNTLWTSGNLIATGTANPYNPTVCIPIADFNYDKTLICQGASVAYTDLSYNATPTIWNWTFGGGGTPNTSTIANPTIVYNSPGTWGTTNQPGTTAGSGSITKSNIITVSSLTADYSGVIVDGFENATNFNNDWIILDPTGGQTYERSTAASSSGSASVRLLNYSIPDAGEIDELISPSYDLSVLTGPTLNFEMAFARRQSSNNDKLYVWYSLDCGESWLLVMAPMQGSSMSTIGSTFKSSFWTPTNSDWASKTASLASMTTETNVRFKFQFTSGNGNNLYLDDINIDGVLSVNDEFNNIGSFNVYPNPTSSGAQISFNLKENVKHLSVKVKNAVGQEVITVINGQAFSVGKYNLKVDEKRQLASGVYFIEFNADDNVKVEKLIVQ